MKIRITETQYKSLLKEDKATQLLNRIKEETMYRDFSEILSIIFNKYALTSNMIKSNDGIRGYVDYISNWWIRKAYQRERGWNIIGNDLSKVNQQGRDYVEEKIDEFYSDKVSDSYEIKDPFRQIKELGKINNTLNRVFTNAKIGEHIVDTMEGLVDDVVNDTFSKDESVRTIINRLGQLKKILPSSNSQEMLGDTIRRVGEKNGFTMVPKPFEWTFQKGGGQIQSIINYIKDTPKVPKKTRRGWMQSIGEDPERRGWNSRLWSALLAADIVQSKRDGRDTIYTLGPNAEPFEQGRLVGY